MKPILYLIAGSPTETYEMFNCFFTQGHTTKGYCREPLWCHDGVDDKYIALPEIQNLIPYAEAGDGYFFSTESSINSWNTTSRNYTMVVNKTSEIITPLCHVSPNKLIMSSKSSVSLYLRMYGNEIFKLTKHLVCDQQKEDGLALNNCAHNTSADLGPIAVDYSQTAIYYTDGYAVQRVLVLNISAPNLPTPIELDESLGDVTAMAFNKDYSYLFAIQQRDLTQTIRMYDLATSEPIRSIQFKYPDKVLQAVPLSNGLLLFHSDTEDLVLVNTYTGQFSVVNKGITHLPCDSSECGQNQIRVRDLIRNDDFQRRGEYLYGVDINHRPIAFKYNSKYT